MAVNEEILKIAGIIAESVSAEKIYLFGSYAYGMPNEDSDYDFYVVIPDGSMRPLEAAQTARRSLSKISRKKPVDILADYHSRFDTRSKLNTLEKKVFNDGVVLYERT
jgi:predicted nucleotidyltransferase